MKIAIDKRGLSGGHAVRGVGSYTKNLVKALRDECKNSKACKIDVVKSFSNHYDLIHYPYFDLFYDTLPINKITKTVVTVHDVIPLIYPKHYPPGTRGKIRFIKQKRSLRTVDAVITDTETSKKDIVRFLDVPHEEIYPVHLAPAKHFIKIVNRKSLTATRKKYNLPSSFVLYVGDINYNKNISTLIEACKLAKTPLVIVGKQALEIEELGTGLDVLRGPRDWIRFLFNIPHPELAHYETIMDQFRGNKDIIRTGFVSDSELVAIYNLASVYCQPSLYEGFGLPPLEAMASGTPVICARTQALVEIAEGAALFADPKGPEDFAKKIKKIVKNKKPQKNLVKKGKENLKRFSWEKTAVETLRVYKEVISK